MNNLKKIRSLEIHLYEFQVDIWHFITLKQIVF